MCRHVMLTNGGIKAVKTFSGLSVTVGEMTSLHKEESVSAAKFVLWHRQTRGYKPELCRFGMG